MATYDNTRLKPPVVHWVSEQTPKTRTACHFLDSDKPSWDWENFDPVGVPADVTCCHCRERASFLDASEKAFEEGVNDA